MQGALQRLDEGAAQGAVLWASAVVDAGREGDIAEWFHQTSWIPSPAHGFLASVGPSGQAAPEVALESALRAEESVVESLTEVADLSDSVVGAIAIPFGDYLRLWALVVSADGRRAVRVHRTGRQDGAAELASRLVDELLRRGGRTILEGDG